MASVLPNPAKKNILQAWVDAATQIKMMLVNSSHTNDIDTQEFISNVDANEVTGTGYTAGGQNVANVTVAADTTNDRGELTFDDVVWDASGGSLTASYAVLYDDTATNTTSQILAIYDFSGSQTATDANFTISADATDGAVGIA